MNGRTIVWPRRPRQKQESDLRVLSDVGRDVEILVRVRGADAPVRWRGRIVSRRDAIVELAPLGCGGTTIEVSAEDVLECFAFAPTNAAAVASIESMQRLRLGGAR